MLLKLTNNTESRRGKEIIINMDHIISIYPDEIDGAEVTIMYSNTQEQWHVAENLETIMKLVEAKA
jgi:hypothetical protein